MSEYITLENVYAHTMLLYIYAHAEFTLTVWKLYYCTCYSDTINISEIYWYLSWRHSLIQLFILVKLSEIVVECINSRCMTEHMNVISYKLLIQVEIEILVGKL